MPRPCSICNHPERSKIEAAIIAGTPITEAASNFTVGRMALERHTNKCIPEHLKQSQAAKEEAQSLDIVKQLRDINAITLTILKEARDGKKNGIALFAIDRVMKQIELQAKLIGAIDTPQVNIYMAPEWQVIRNTIVQAITPYPDARVAVAAALSKLEGVNNARLN